MVRRANSRRIIKEYLEQMPYTSHRLFDLIRGKIRRSPTFGQVKGICLSDTDIQYLAKNNIETFSEFISENTLFFNNYRGLRQLFIMIMINSFLKNET